MTARQIVERKLKGLSGRSGEGGAICLSAEGVALGVEVCIHFLLAAVLSGAVILEGMAPFGVALVAVSGAGVCGGGALLGACFGYLTMLEFSPALRYASAGVLTFAVNFAFYDCRFLRYGWAMPLVAGLCSGFTGGVLQAPLGWSVEAVMRLGLELCLTVAAARSYRTVLLPVRKGKGDRLFSPERRSGLLFLLAGVLAALQSLELWEGAALGGAAAQVLVLCAAWQGGAAAGGAVGMAAGVAVDLATGAVPIRTAVCGLGGLLAGIRRRGRRLLVAAVYTLAVVGIGVWVRGEGQFPSLLWETALAVPAFLLIPHRFLARMGVWLGPEETGAADLRAQKLAQQRLVAAAQAFRTLYESLRTSFRVPKNDNDVATVFDRTAGRVCRSCTLRVRCWQQEYTATFNALNDATPAMVERGRAEAGDFPRHFSDRCIRFSEFLQTVNEELTALFYRRQYNARLRENRAAVCRQYSQLSDLLAGAASELSRELVPDLMGDRRLRARVAELGLEVRTAVYRDARGLLRVEAEGRDSGELTRAGRLSELSQLLAVPLRVEQEGEDTLFLVQQEPLMAVAGVAAQKKNGETVSGDAGTYFKRPDGMLFVLLCDGMGSGPEANRESALAVRLLEQFLQAGVDARQALTTLSAALALRGEETGGFTTVDLLRIDLFTGESELFKLGAAPTYVRQGGEVRRLTGRSLPAGLAEGVEGALDRFSLRLSPGDCVLMVSDGICGTGEDDWLQERFARFDGASPKELARELITDSPRDVTDDRTALAIRIETRP